MTNTTNRKFTVIHHTTAGFREPKLFVLTLVRETKTTLILAFPGYDSSTGEYNAKRVLTFSKETRDFRTTRRARPNPSVYSVERYQWLYEIFA